MGKRLITILFEILVGLVFIVIFALVFDKYTRISKIVETKRYKGTIIDTLVSLKTNINKQSILKEYNLYNLPPNFTQRSNIKVTNSVPILLYHDLNDKATDSDPSYDQFKKHMFALKKAGYQTITLDDFSNFLNKKKELSDKSILITFDDGIANSYYRADPIFEVLDFNAVMFIITKYSIGEGTNYYLSRHEVDRMIDSGRWEIQPHGYQAHDLQTIDKNGTKGHFLSNKLWLGEVERMENEDEFRYRVAAEFQNTKKQLEHTFNIRAYTFAFPFGDFGQSTVNFDWASEIIFEEVNNVFQLATIYQFWPTRGFSHNHSLPNKPMIKRLNVQPSWDEVDLLEVLESGFTKNLPYELTKNNFSDWITSWGEMDLLENNEYLLKSKHNTTSGQIVLDGSYLWTNYKYSVSSNSQDVESISLLARVQDSDNYIACTFEPDQVILELVSNGETEIRIKKEENIGITKHDYAVEVINEVTKCFVDDNQIISQKITNAKTNGGIGLKIWHSIKENAWLNFSNLKVVDTYEKH